MKAISRFVGTTILGGVLVLTPIVVLEVVLSKALDFVRRGLQPLMALIPKSLAPGPTMTVVLTILLLGLRVFPCWAFREDASRAEVRELPRSDRSFEGARLRVPQAGGNERSGARRVGRASGCARPFRRLVADRGSGRLLVGGYVAVFVPNSPNPMSESSFSLPPTTSARSTCRSPRRSPACGDAECPAPCWVNSLRPRRRPSTFARRRYPCAARRVAPWNGAMRSFRRQN